jgi:hypothetical protein
MDTTVITPIMGNQPNLTVMGIKSVAGKANHWLIADGPIKNTDNERIITASAIQHGCHCVDLPENTGQGKYYGHRIYAGFGYFVNTPYIMFLDEDNWLEADAIDRMEEALNRHPDAIAVTCRRKIWDSDMNLIGYDDFESVPGSFHDTSTVMYRTEAYRKHLKDGWGDFGWGADRVISELMCSNFPVVHIPEYLLNYTAPDRLKPFFHLNCTKL